MTTAAEIRAAIVARIQSVPDVGIVHDRERYLRAEERFRRLYVVTAPNDSEQLRGWWVRRESVRETQPSIGRRLDVTSWRIQGYLALSDEAATETEFDALIESIRDAFRADLSLDGTVDAGGLGTEPDGLQLLDVGPVTFLRRAVPRRHLVPDHLLLEPAVSKTNPEPKTYEDATQVPPPEPLPTDEHTGKGGSYLIGKDGKRRPADEPAEPQAAPAKK